MDLSFPNLNRLEALARGIDGPAAADVGSAARDLRAGMESARAQMERLAQAQAQASVHAAMLIGQRDEALAETGRLRASELGLRRISDNMLDLVCQVDLSGNFVYVSGSYRSVLPMSNRTWNSWESRNPKTHETGGEIA